jgi:hypothetical protein
MLFPIIMDGFLFAGAKQPVTHPDQEQGEAFKANFLFNLQTNIQISEY